MPRVNTKILTTVILLVFRGLKFESDADIGGKDSFRSGTNQFPLISSFNMQHATLYSGVPLLL